MGTLMLASRSTASELLTVNFMREAQNYVAGRDHYKNEDSDVHRNLGQWSRS